MTSLRTSGSAGLTDTSGLTEGPSAADAESRRRRRVHKVESTSPYRPLVLAMLLFGMLFYLPKHSGMRHPRISWSLVYHGCLLILLWGNVIRFFTAYSLRETFGPTLVGRILLHTFVAKGAVCASACTFMSLRRERGLGRLLGLHEQLWQPRRGHPQC